MTNLSSFTGRGRLVSSSVGELIHGRTSPGGDEFSGVVEEVRCELSLPITDNAYDLCVLLPLTKFSVVNSIIGREDLQD